MRTLLFLIIILTSPISYGQIIEIKGVRMNLSDITISKLDSIGLEESDTIHAGVNARYVDGSTGSSLHRQIQYKEKGVVLTFTDWVGNNEFNFYKLIASSNKMTLVVGKEELMVGTKITIVDFEEIGWKLAETSSSKYYLLKDNIKLTFESTLSLNELRAKSTSQLIEKIQITKPNNR